MEKPFHNSNSREIPPQKQSAYTILTSQRFSDLDGDDLRTLLNTIPEVIIIKDGTGRWIEANDMALNLFELDKQTFRGNRHADFMKTYAFYREAFTQCEETDQRAWSLEKVFTFEETIVRSDGQKVVMEFIKTPLFNESGLRQRLIVIGRDITERKKIETSLNHQTIVLEMIAKGKPLQHILQQLIESVETQSGAICSIFLAHNGQLFFSEGPSMPEDYIQAINGIDIGPTIGACGKAAYYKKTVIAADIHQDPHWDDYRDLTDTYGLRACWSSPIIGHDGNVLGTFARYYPYPYTPDETELMRIERVSYLAMLAVERKRSEDTIFHMAYFDSLTHLPNRKYFRDLLDSALIERERSRSPLSVIYMDLDRFKLINDSMGHTIGDILIQNVAERLAGCLGPHALASRQAGDEFTILLKDTTEAETAHTAQCIMEAMARPFVLNGQEVYITTSLGISRFPNDGDTTESLIKNADIAMYQAKKQGKNAYRFYSKEFEHLAANFVQWNNRIRKALEKEEFILHYQPQYHMASRRLIGVEALIRWRQSDTEIIPPSQFVPAAEEMGTIVPIGEWVLREACRQWKEWQDQGASLFTISVNLSSRQMHELDLIDRISQILHETGMDPNYLELEVTESMTMDLERAAAFLQKLKALGIKIAIDDFGTGFSSLSYLKSLPIHRIKIDRSFIKDITQDPSNQNIVKTIIALGDNLNIRVIAEGVETSEQFEILHQYRCSEVQGFWLGYPMSASDITALFSGALA